MKKGVCTLKLEKLQKVYNQQGEIDPTLIRCTYSIIDFNSSGNKQYVSKEVALISAPTLKFKPLLCQYKETDDYENPNDDFGTHGECEGKLRDGSDYMMTDTHAIGVAEKEGYLGVIKDDDGNDLDVLLCDFLLWTYRYPNEISLINQFVENNESLYSSCEYYYTSSKKEKGIEIIDSLVFDGHCILGRSIEPAYQSSKLISFNTKWNKAINQCIKKTNVIDNIENKKIINNESKKEDEQMAENLFFKSLNELSHGDIRSKIMDALSKTMTADEFNYCYLSNWSIYDTYFVYENYEDSKWVNYKVPYSKTETEVVVNLADKVLVKRDSVWVEVGQVTELQTSLNEKITELETSNEKIEELQTSLNTKEAEIIEKDELIKGLNEKIETVDLEKSTTVEKFNELSETVTSLNAKVKVLEPLAEAYNKEQYEKSLNSAMDFYKEKFESVDAIDVFEKDDTVELIKKSINSNKEESEKAKFSLNELIVSNVKAVSQEDIKPKVSLNSVQPLVDNKDLRNDIDIFEETYGFKRS